MEESFGSRLKHAWNAFRSREPTRTYYNNSDYGPTYYTRPDRRHYSYGNEKSIATAVYNRIAMDAASIDIKHIQLDEQDRFNNVLPSELNQRLLVEANLDQAARAFRQDIFASLLDEGCIAVVPIDTDTDPDITQSFKILSMRTGRITQWSPTQVKVRVYNDQTGQKEEVWFNKKNVAIIENPLYAVINEKSSTMQRLIRKLNLLDAIDEQSGSGKLDVIIQLPYVVKSQSQKERASDRKKSLEEQLSNSKYGVAYIDSTERVTQLNRPVENNLMKQVEYLTNLLFSQLGITQAIMDGTADEATMLNYYSRTVEPLVTAVVEEFYRKFLTKTARTQRQSIMYFRNPFKLVPVKELAEISDKVTRNEIMSSNEVRTMMIGLPPSDDPKADELRNSNINQSGEEQPPTEVPIEEKTEEGGKSQNGATV